MVHYSPPLPPRLCQTELERFVSGFLNQKDQYREAVAHNGSPLWLLDLENLKKNAKTFSRAFQAYFPKAKFYFAMKSNNHPMVSKALVESGFGLDVSSGKELNAALAAGADSIIFSGPGKTDEELSLAARHRQSTTLLLDSMGELDRLLPIIEHQETTSNLGVGIRLNTEPNGLWRKFGILPDELPVFWKKIEQISGIQFKGLQFHSSWNLSPDRQIEFIESLGKTLAAMPASFNKAMEFLDIGGGYWPPEGEWLRYAGTRQGAVDRAMGRETGMDMRRFRDPALPISYFAALLFQAVKNHVFPWADCRICFEPGRWICHSSMHLALTVIDKKYPDMVITDAGTNAVGWERFETDYFPVINLTRSSLDEIPCCILGSLCTPHDVWGDAYFGKDIQPGDLLMIPCQGAYTYSLGQNFIKPLPRVVLI